MKDVMDLELLQKKFARMGARVKISEAGDRWRNPAGLDIKRDSHGEFFDLRVGRDEPVSYEVADLRPELRHLLLLARRGEQKEKFLCGHDERHWFGCAVPGARVSGVRDAFEALQPLAVRRRAAALRTRERFSRRNRVFVRQGEWFFLPAPAWFRVDERVVLTNEPISRGRGSKPHVCQQLVRTGGELVWVCRHYRNGVSAEQYERILRSLPGASRWGWVSMRRNPAVYARGTVRHRDHKTVVLDGWHSVLMNRENEAPFVTPIYFLD